MRVSIETSENEKSGLQTAGEIILGGCLFGGLKDQVFCLCRAQAADMPRLIHNDKFM
jgi:hypothetical protein